MKDVLHELLHELLGSINGINLMAQMCAQFITVIKIEKLEGESKEQMAANFSNVTSYHKKAIKDLNLVVNALTEIGSENIGSSLKKDVACELEKVKNIITSAEKLYRKILKVDTKENLLSFAQELEEVEPICQSMAEKIRASKKELVAQGKY